MALEITIGSSRGAQIARVAASLLPSGSAVIAGQVVAEVETHKVTQVVEAPGDGVLIHSLELGSIVDLSRPLAYVARDEDDLDALRALSLGSISTVPWTEVVADPLPQVGTGTRVSIQKATEIAVLSGGAGGSMLSMVGTPVGVVRRAPSTPDFFCNKILDLVVFEASRLLRTRRFRVLNAWFNDGAIVLHDKVCAGVGFDEGRRLTTYVIEDSDQKSLSEIQAVIVDGLMRYVGRKLSVDEVSTSTFTVSDLSASTLTFSLPLLSKGQSMIVAVTRDAQECYSLFVSFDHRVTEGAVAASFVETLAERLRSFGVSMAKPSLSEPAIASACSFCGSTLDREVNELSRRGLLRINDAADSVVLCCLTCWSGW